jgi:hypothetical protein
VTAAAPAPVLTGVRLSALAKCPRWAALGGLGVEEDPVPPEWEEYRNRGRLFERYVYRQYIARYGPERVQWQRPIPWGDGWEGHADIAVLRPDAGFLLVEVVSTVAPASVIPDKRMQVQMYLHFDRDAEQAAVHAVNPSRLTREDAISVRLDGATVELIETRVEQVRRALKTRGDDMPDCACASPTACRFKGCPFTSVAWEGWAPPPPGELTDPDDVRAALELYGTEIAYRNSKAMVEDAKARREAAREHFRGRLASGGDYRVGPLRLRCSVEEKPRVRYDGAGLVLAGVVTEEQLAPFARPEKPREHWTINRMGEEPLPEIAPDDFGDVPW